MQHPGILLTYDITHSSAVSSPLLSVGYWIVFVTSDLSLCTFCQDNEANKKLPYPLECTLKWWLQWWSFYLHPLLLLLREILFLSSDMVLYDSIIYQQGQAFPDLLEREHEWRTPALVNWKHSSMYLLHLEDSGLQSEAPVMMFQPPLGWRHMLWNVIGYPWNSPTKLDSIWPCSKACRSLAFWGSGLWWLAGMARWGSSSRISLLIL